MARLISNFFLATLAALSYAAFAAGEAAEPTARQKAVATASAGAIVQGAVQLGHYVGGLQRPWCIAFVPGGDLLVTEKVRGLRIVRDGALLLEPVAGTPPGIFAKEDSGLLDVALDP